MYSEKKYAIWGCGICGKGIARNLKNIGWCIKFFIDSDPNKWNIENDNIIIISPEKFLDEMSNAIDVLIIGVDDVVVEDKILSFIKERISLDKVDYEILGCNTAKDIICRECLRYFHTNMKYKWNVDFLESLQNWIDNIDSEIDYWKRVISGSGAAKKNYIKRIENNYFHGLDTNVTDIANKLNAGDVVVDLGSGPVTMYGEFLSQEEKIKVVPMDPLAHHYNMLNNKFDRKIQQKKCVFGLFEFVDSYLPKEYADIIIINNALDHCIDPYKSIMKCINVLKVGGMLHMVHRRSEAVFEGWTGLHKWNVDYNSDDEFILWNKNNAVNVSKELFGNVQIRVMHSPNDVPLNDCYVTIDIRKIKENVFLESAEYYKNDRDDLAFFLQMIMKKDADMF